MSDRWAVLVAVCAAWGASRPSALPALAACLVVVAGLVLRRPLVLCLGVAALASALAARSLAGLDGVEAAPVADTVTLVSDPAPAYGGVQVDARLGGRRVELHAAGSSADALRPRLAGEQVAVRGRLEPAPPGAPWLTARHVSGRVQVYAVESWAPGTTPTRIANGLRRTLVEGAAPLGPGHRSLYTGLVIGDDREQPAGLADDFLAAGLTHLLAVSGQNVAFTLALAGPVLRRLRLWPRLGATLAVIGLFGLTTRFEPSVLRAAAMAGLAVTTGTIGMPVSRLRVLALAVAGLLLVDPLLVGSVGFQLSVAAATAIVLLAPRLTDLLPGPRPLREAVAVTLAAQLGVAPVLLATFGPLPVASLPANLLAVPAAGLVMVWGLTGGLVAGVAGSGVAELVHLPTRALLAWLSEVAARAARLPLGRLQAWHVAAAAGGLALGALGRRAASRAPAASAGLRRAGLSVAASAVGLAALAAHAPVPLRTGLAAGIVRWHHGGTEVVVLGGAGGRVPLGPPAVLGALREAGVGAIDLLVVADASVPPSAVDVLADRHPIGAVVAAAGVGPLALDAPRTPAPRSSGMFDVGALEVRVTPTSDRLVVEARPGEGVGAPR